MSDPCPVLDRFRATLRDRMGVDLRPGFDAACPPAPGPGLDPAALAVHYLRTALSRSLNDLGKGALAAQCAAADTGGAADLAAQIRDVAGDAAEGHCAGGSLCDSEIAWRALQSGAAAIAQALTAATPEDAATWLGHAFAEALTAETVFRTREAFAELRERQEIAAQARAAAAEYAQDIQRWPTAEDPEPARPTAEQCDQLRDLVEQARHADRDAEAALKYAEGSAARAGAIISEDVAAGLGD